MGIWLLDEKTSNKVKDVSDNDNHGEIQGAKWAKGKFGSALKFNGKTDRVVIPNSDSLYAKKVWTITSWIFVNESEVGFGHILGKRNDWENNTNYAFRTDGKGINNNSFPVILNRYCDSCFHKIFYITAMSMFNPADALTNIELAVES
ncbi:hypothetical protein CMK18_05460 [Candidatus Poribacteria bacterium]|nr:hypothetical protein [Candidatus Poribacteria bacterium]